MSYPRDDQRILAEIERGLTHDDPALASLMTTLSQQFPQQPEHTENARALRRNPRVVAAVILSVIAVLALILTAALSSPSAPPDGEENRPNALPVAAATQWAP